MTSSDVIHDTLGILFGRRNQTSRHLTPTTICGRLKEQQKKCTYDGDVHAITKLNRLSVWLCIKSETQVQDSSSIEEVGEAGLLKSMAAKGTMEVRKSKRIRCARNRPLSMSWQYGPGACVPRK